MPALLRSDRTDRSGSRHMPATGILCG